MTGKLLKRRGWRAPTGAPLIAELDRVNREAEQAFDRPLGQLSPDELVALAADLLVRAESAADLLHILARHRRKENG
jgi:hypothetical protein